MITKLKKVAYLTLVFAAYACQQDDTIVTATPEEVAPPQQIETVGFYLLNEGNMGSNKATIDYFDYESGIYTVNMYAEANPTKVKELGDVGNDIKVYG